MHPGSQGAAQLIDINALTELAYVRRENGHLAVGARPAMRSSDSAGAIAAALSRPGR
jgi:hypothetical protein